ncbi:MAG: putative metal-binding motif-containing protein, partial [Myxococcota bacterium]|nr:putative metal-binding motif-containing protein [Myxococcota bacterium]
CNDSSAGIYPGAFERCNGADDNCDGTTDEGFVVGDTCSVGQGGCVGIGLTQCGASGFGAVCSAIPGEPTPEICDDLDNDCNGYIDDVPTTGTADINNCGGCGIACVAGPNEVPQCLDNQGVVGCRYSCEAGFLNLDGDPSNGCEYACTPTGEELCDGIDNNCNGIIDENTDTFFYDGPEDTIGVGECHRGYQACENGNLVVIADAVTPTEELCDNRDNNCDGQVDEGLPVGQACDGDDPDQCAYGIWVCGPEGSLICTDGPDESTIEVCDGWDNDCDGETDEDLPAALICAQDCAGEWMGMAYEDACGVCDDNPNNDCDPSCECDTLAGECDINADGQICGCDSFCGDETLDCPCDQQAGCDVYGDGFECLCDPECSGEAACPCDTTAQCDGDEATDSICICDTDCAPTVCPDGQVLCHGDADEFCAFEADGCPDGTECPDGMQQCQDFEGPFCVPMEETCPEWIECPEDAQVCPGEEGPFCHPEGEPCPVPSNCPDGYQQCDDPMGGFFCAPEAGTCEQNAPECGCNNDADVCDWVSPEDCIDENGESCPDHVCHCDPLCYNENECPWDMPQRCDTADGGFYCEHDDVICNETPWHDDTCQSDDECEDGDICFVLGSACLEACNPNGTCSEGFWCDVYNWSCVPEPGSEYDNHVPCNEDGTCAEGSQLCFTHSECRPGCDADSDCGDGEFCDLEQGICVFDHGTDLNCPEGDQVCHDNFGPFCHPSHQPCPVPEECSAGTRPCDNGFGGFFCVPEEEICDEQEVGCPCDTDIDSCQFVSPEDCSDENGDPCQEHICHCDPQCFNANDCPVDMPKRCDFDDGNFYCEHEDIPCNTE